MMTRRERLSAMYEHKAADRPCVYSRTGFPKDDPTYDALKRLLHEKTELKLSFSADYMISHPKATTQVKPFSPDFNLHVEHLHTPGGLLTRETYIGKKGTKVQGQDMVRKHFIQSHEDALCYLSIDDAIETGEGDSYLALDGEMGDRGIVEVNLGMNPAGLVCELMGTELFALWSLDHRELLHELCGFARARLQRKLHALFKHKLGRYFATLGHEYLTPPIHSPDDFREFVTLYDQPIMDDIHDYGGFVHVHCHGSIKKVFNDLLCLGVDVLHPFEAPPMGDITPREARALAGDRMTLEGNIQIGDMYTVSTDELRSMTRRLIDDAFINSKGLIVSPTASPFAYGKGEECLPRYQAMIDEVLSYPG